MEELIRRSDALIECEGLTPIECLAMQERIKSIPAVEPKTKVIAQVTFVEDKMREIVNEAVERIKEEYDIVSDWIPCSERMPEEHEWIGTEKFGTTISDKVHITFDVNGKRFVKTLSLQNGELSNHEKLTMDAFYKGWKMVAWMPLPKPYKEGADDDNNL